MMRPCPDDLDFLLAIEPETERRGADSREFPGVFVGCRRLGVPRAVREHLTCPYCFGRTADVLTADPRCFCDWDAGHDPLIYGFPATHGRHLQG